MSQRELEGECGSDLCGPNGKGTRAGMGGGGEGDRQKKGLGTPRFFSNFRLSLPTKVGGS